MRRLKLHTKIILMEFILLVTVVLVTGPLFVYIFSQSILQHTGENALDIARIVAENPMVREAFYSDNPSAVIQPIAESIRKSTGAEFVVVGNRDSIRYSHPIPERIGKKMVGGDNDMAFVEGREYVSQAEGSLGQSLRGKVPVVGRNGEIVGIVSVGFLTEDIWDSIWDYNKEVFWILMAGLMIGSIGAVILARIIKRDIFGLEPVEIASLFKQKEAILQSIREGIIAINDKEEITVVNNEAKRILQVDENVIGQPVKDVIPHSELPRVLQSGQSEHDIEMILNDAVIVTNRIPIEVEGKRIGVVATFRDQTELRSLSAKLSEFKQYTDSLRAQTHEFMNKLHLIAGYIQLKKYDEVLGFINQVTTGHQQLLEFLVHRIQDPTVSALLVGKYNRAAELKVDLEVDPNSRLSALKRVLDQYLLTTVIGNLLDNAMDAVIDLEESRRSVKITIREQDDAVVVRVTDKGTGIPPDIYHRIFQEGVSGKPNHSGIGLALVKRCVDYVQGETSIETSESGTVMEVRLPLSIGEETHAG
ncbi:ATP-binding protein [Effusibacillus consociatus]|uniref:histidine kinase n=1 Tax=Effusibacillus consociatus TaxID=1117041 RepID=A0ABV9PYL0_9BACL